MAGKGVKMDETSPSEVERLYRLSKYICGSVPLRTVDGLKYSALHDEETKRTVDFLDVELETLYIILMQRDEKGLRAAYLRSGLKVSELLKTPVLEQIVRVFGTSVSLTRRKDII